MILKLLLIMAGYVFSILVSGILHSKGFLKLFVKGDKMLTGVTHFILGILCLWPDIIIFFFHFLCGSLVILRGNDLLLKENTVLFSTSCFEA